MQLCVTAPQLGPDVDSVRRARASGGGGPGLFRLLPALPGAVLSDSCQRPCGTRPVSGAGARSGRHGNELSGARMRRGGPAESILPGRSGPWQSRAGRYCVSYLSLCVSKVNPVWATNAHARLLAWAGSTAAPQCWPFVGVQHLGPPGLLPNIPTPTTLPPTRSATRYVRTTPPSPPSSSTASTCGGASRWVVAAAACGGAEAAASSRRELCRHRTPRQA